MRFAPTAHEFSCAEEASCDSLSGNSGEPSVLPFRGVRFLSLLGTEESDSLLIVAASATDSIRH